MIKNRIAKNASIISLEASFFSSTNIKKMTVTSLYSIIKEDRI
jgi:hypothetical protein